MQDGRRTAKHVAGRPHLAQHRAQHPPVAHDLVLRPHGHDQAGHGQVSDGQREDQVVGPRLEMALQQNGGQDEDVADDGDQDEETEGGGQCHDVDQGRLGQVVGVDLGVAEEHGTVVEVCREDGRVC